MVGLSDIPFVGKVVDRISDASIDSMIRGFRYTFHSKDLVKDLDSEVTKANQLEEDMSIKVAAERANGKIIKDHVSKWQKEADEIKESAKEFTEKYKNSHSWRCIQCLPIPNPISRLRLGREAVQKTERLTELICSGKELLAEEIAHLAPTDNLPKSDTEFQDFESRQDAYKKLWEALVGDSSPILGIYGMPGVGKTRMMEQIWKEAKEKKIFDKVTRGNVGNEKLNLIQLQSQIAGYLDCHFESQVNVESRASQLKQSLLNAGKTLVILDDVWSEIPLDDIGIPCGDGTSSVGCKIFLTSRDEEVCLRNNCETPVKITPLSDDEAWEQFRNIVGTSRIQDEFLAKKVCKKCAGLPLLIHAVGKALKFRTSSTWEDALEQLERGKIENIPRIDKQVYACVKLSIDKLPDDDAKSCLFLCCLFPEDADIRISKLIQLATGSQLVSDGEARVLSMVDTLRFSSLLLDCDNNDKIKLHDIIRDVGRSIAVRDPKYAFLQVRCGLRLPDVADFGTRKFLRLDLQSDNVHIPDDLVCPDLHSLWLKCNNPIQQFSGGLFSMSVNLRFLYVEGELGGAKLQFSLQSWGKLKTLILEDCVVIHINKTNVGLFPKYLETLCIRGWNHPEPLDLSNLKYLRKFEINLLRLKIMPNSISGLSSLEELHIPYGFVIWGDEIVKDDSSVVGKPILVEMNQLTQLKSLRMYFKRSEPFQDAHKLFDNLKLFNIIVGGGRYRRVFSFKKSIELHGDRIAWVGALERLIERAEDVKLKWSYTNVISSIFARNQKAFTDLRELYIKECHKMEHVARMSQGEIQHNSQLKSFSKLTRLLIINCSALRYLFCNSVAKCLAQLQELMIFNCRVMEAIVMNEGSTNEDIIIKFPNLKRLTLSGMPRLRSFYLQKKNVVIPSIQSHPMFDSKVEFPNLLYLELSGCGEINLEAIEFGRDDFTCQLQRLEIRCDNETQLPCKWYPRLSNLETLILSRCWWHELKSECFQRLKALELQYLKCSALFAFSDFKSLHLLQRLEISYCSFLKAIVEDDEISGMNKKKTITLSHLDTVVLKDLPKLKSFIHDANYEFRVPSLSSVEVENCGLSTLFSFSVFTRLHSLKISSCAVLEEIVEDIRSDEISGMNKKTIPLLKLEMVILKDLPELKSFIYSANHECLMPELERVSVSNCGFSSLFMCSAFGTLQKLKALEVEDCISLEGIFEYARGDETSDSNEQIITLSRLETLKVSNCRLLEGIFKYARGDETSDTNTQIITLSQLSSVKLRDLPRLKSFIHGANYDFNMPNLWEMEVDNCGFSTLFTCSVLRNLQEVYTLQVSNCGLLEGIFEYARGDETSDTTNEQIITLSRLFSVKLKDLPNLKSFIHGGANYDFNMPNLWQMEVDNCGFSTLFTCSVFKNLELLESLKVSNCIWLEGIVEDARGDETSDTNDKTITLPQLSIIELEHLPKLKSFGQGYAFNMPNLRDFDLLGCPVLEKFTSLDTKTGMVYVYTEGHEPEEVSDVNDYIKQNFRRGSQLNDGAGELSQSRRFKARRRIEWISWRIESFRESRRRE